MMMFMFFRFLIFAAMFPVLILLWWICRQDRVEKEPPALLAKLFFLGVISAIPAMLLEMLAEIPLQEVRGDTLRIFLENFLGVALMEELCKFVLLKWGSWRSPEFNYRFDGIVYAVFVSLGFAAIENILYVTQSGLGVALARALLSIPGHMVFAVFMGAFYSKAKSRKLTGRSGSWGLMLVGLLVSVVLHGFYDFCLTMDSGALYAVFFVFAIASDFFAWLLVRRFSRADRPV